MKRIIFSDTHLHTWAYGATTLTNGINSRLLWQSQALNEICQYAEENNIQYVYFGGDLFHTHGRIPTQALHVASRFFNRLRQRGIKIRAIHGNHDMEDRQGKIHALSWLNDDETFGTWVDNELLVLALPYTEDEDQIKRFLEEAGKEGGMALLHQGVAGIPLSSGYVINECLTPKMIPENVTAFTGHYHFHKQVSPNLTVIGNLTPLNWSDVDQVKGFVVWDDETGEMEQIIQTSSPNFITWNAKVAKHSDLTNVEGSFVRYTDPVKQKDQEEIRQALIKEGALTVEFPNVEIPIGSSKIKSGEEVTVEHLVKSFEDEGMEPRRLEVGHEVREHRYETPEA